MLFKIEPHIRALLFDCDGTLVDTMPLHWEAWHKTLGVFDVILPPSYLEPYSGIPSEVIIKQINKEFGRSIDHDKFVEQKEVMLYPMLQQAKPIAPVVDVVRSYYKKIPMAVVSGGTLSNVLATLDAVDIRHCFATIVSADDPVAPKPSPDVFLEAARRLEVPARLCQVFEDAEAGIQAGTAAGMVVTDVRKYL